MLNGELKKNFQKQVHAAMTIFLSKSNVNEEFHVLATYIAQVMNFFIIGPMDSKCTAREMICARLFKGDDFYRLSKLVKDEAFEPSELIAAIAYLFRQIAFLHFCERGYVGSDEFSEMMDKVIYDVEQKVLTTFPKIDEQWCAFMAYFREHYLMPWDVRRYSDYKTPANFGTGVDYNPMK